MITKVEFDASDRQMVLLALAELALSRPGWDHALGEIAEHFSTPAPEAISGRELFDQFKRLNADRVKAERIPMYMGPMIAQNDDPDLLQWLNNASGKAGGFLSSLANAGLCADWQNYPLMRPSLLDMRKKYPEYGPQGAVKAEIRQRKEPTLTWQPTYSHSLNSRAIPSPTARFASTARLAVSAAALEAVRSRSRKTRRDTTFWFSTKDGRAHRFRRERNPVAGFCPTAAPTRPACNC